MLKKPNHFGSLIGEYLSWTKHIEEISKTISSAIGTLKHIRSSPNVSLSKSTKIIKIIKRLFPAYLQNCFCIHSAPYNLRDSEMKLDLPKPCTNYCGLATTGRCYGIASVNLWKLGSLRHFKREIVRLYNNFQSNVGFGGGKNPSTRRKTSRIYVCMSTKQ